MAKDGEVVVYELIVVDNKFEQETADTVKESNEDVTKHHEEQNERRVEDNQGTGNEREDIERSTGSRIKDIAKDTTKAIGAAALNVGEMAVKSAMDMDKAMNQFAASTGKTQEETERYQNVLEEIYTNNYGESFEDIAAAMTDVNRQLGDMPEAQMQGITESAFALRDTFGYEIPESTQAAKTMMDNFGISGEEAMNLIAAGAQNGLDNSGNLMDSIDGYSGEFAKLGLSADDMFKIIQKGADTGAWNLDNIGEAVKEFSNRTIDGSESTKAGFEAIGLSADDMASKFAAGGDTAKGAFQETITGLAEMKDPIEQNAAGVALFGTMWEDLGPEGVAALADIGDAAYATGDELNNIKDIRFDDLGSMFTELMRSVEMLLIPLGEQLIPVLTQLIDAVLPVLEEAIPPIVEVIGQLIQQLAPMLEEILPVLLDLFEELMPSLMEMIDAILPVLVELFDQLLPPLMEIIEAALPVLVELFSELVPLLVEIIEAVLPVLVELFAQLVPPLAEIIEAVLPILIELFSQLLLPLTQIISEVMPVFLELIDALLPVLQALLPVLTPLIECFIQLLDPILQLISSALVPLVEALTPIISVIIDSLIPVLEVLLAVFKEVFEGIAGDLKERIQLITSTLNEVIDFVKNVFTGNWKGAWENVKNIFSNIVTGLGEVFKAPINLIIDQINRFIAGVNAMKVPDWVPEIGGKGFNIKPIPRLKAGIDFVPGDAWPAYLDYGERVLTQQENQRFNVLGGLSGLEGALSQGNYSPEQKIVLGKGSIVVNSNIDGKLAAQTMAPYIDTELGEAKETGMRDL